MSKVISTYHLVFGTRMRRPTIPAEMRRELYNMIFYELKKQDCFVRRINGTSNHVHILFDLHPMQALAKVVSVVKSQTSLWMKNDPRFPYFNGWGKEYFASCVETGSIDRVFNYILNQEVHHGMISFEDEMVEFFSHNHWKFLPEYLG